MGRIVAVEYVTLDGVVEDPAWSGPYFNEELQTYQWDNLFESDAMLLGRVTYEGFAASWPSMEAETGEFGVRMNTMGKYVASRTLTETGWNATLLGADVPAEVAALKQADQTLLIYGSPTLVETLRAAGLIDEYRLMVFPVVVGTGRRLFADAATPGAMDLVASRTTSAGVAVLTYRPAPTQ